MILTVLLLAAFSICIWFMNKRSQYIRWLVVISFVLGIMIFFLQVYISEYTMFTKKLVLQTKNSMLFSLDYVVWQNMPDVVMGAHPIIRIINVCAAVFIYLTLAFSVVYGLEETSKKTKLMLLPLGIPPLFVALFYDPLLSFHLYIWVLNGVAAGNVDFYVKIIRIVQIINTVMFNVYFFSALIIWIKKYTASKIKIRKRQILFVAMNLLTTAMLFMAIFIWLPIKELNICNYYIKLTFIPTDFTIPYWYFSYLPIIIAVFIILNIYLIGRYQLLNRMDKQKRRTLKRSLKQANQNYQGVFHAFKNNFIAIKFLTEKMNAGTMTMEELVNTSNNIVALCDEYIQKINVLQERLKNVSITLEETNVTQIIEDIVSDRNKTLAGEIRITFAQHDAVLMNVDIVYLTDVLNNILDNGVEAIRQKKRHDGWIQIEMESESEWAVIRITDNGTGVSKQNLSRIFNPFFSTKNLKNNWGVGLAYSKSVINSHGGDIDVNSEYGHWTSFEIVLPRLRG